MPEMTRKVLKDRKTPTQQQNLESVVGRRNPFMINLHKSYVTGLGLKLMTPVHEDG